MLELKVERTIAINDFQRLLQKLIIKIWSRQCNEDPSWRGKLFVLKDLIVHKAIETDEVVQSARSQIEDELMGPSLDVNFGFSGAVNVYAIMSTVEDEITAWEPEPSKVLGIRRSTYLPPRNKRSNRATSDAELRHGINE